MAAVMEMEEERGMSILLRYQGPAVDDGSMDVYQAAANMVAFSDFVVAAAQELYGEGIQVKAEVNAFQRGSFETDLLFHVAGASLTLLTMTPDVPSVLEAVKESLSLFKFLKGKPPARIERHDDHSVRVTNNNGTAINIHAESLNLTLSEKGGKAAAQFVCEALSKPGIESLNVTSDGLDMVRATKSEAHYFHQITEETPVIEQTLKMGLTIEMPSFKDGNKWIMWDGEASLRYAMEDEEFLKRIDSGERFGKGDILICDVRVSQTKSNGKLSIQRAIIKVHDHKIGHEQIELGV